jgi:hypothetical protein
VNATRFSACPHGDPIDESTTSEKPSVVRAEKRLHAAGEVGLRGHENDVQVIGHEREGLNNPRTSNGGSAEMYDRRSHHEKVARAFMSRFLPHSG